MEIIHVIIPPVHSCQMPVDQVAEDAKEEETTIENRKTKSHFVVGLKKWGGLLPPYCLPLAFSLLFHLRVFRKCAVAVFLLLLDLVLALLYVWGSCQRM